MGIYVAEVTVAIDALGNTNTLYFSTAGFVTSPSDTPPNQFFEPRISQPALLRRDIFSSGTTTGRSSVGYGEMVLVNNDGGLDFMLNYGFDGRELIIRYGEDGAAYPGGFSVVFRGTMQQCEMSWNNVTIKLRDKQEEFSSKKLQTTTFAGNNALPLGLEGVDDLRGRPKPVCYGKVYNISPPCVNTSKLIYQVNDSAVNSVDKVYDRGVELTKGADYADQTDMETNAPLAGNFRVWPTGGYFRLGSSPSGQITADVVQGASSANRTVAQILKSIAIDRGGLTVGDIDANDVIDLDTMNSAEVGVYVDSDTDVSSVMDDISNSVGAWWGFDNLGKMRLQILESPGAIAALSLTTTEIIRLERVATSDEGRGIPAYKCKVNYKKNYTVQDSDLAGSVTDVRRNEINKDWKVVESVDADVKLKHPLAPELVFDTLLVDATDAQNEADRRLTIYRDRQDVYIANAHIDSDVAGYVDLANVVSLRVNRFGLDNGVNFRIIGYELDLKRNRASLSLWNSTNPDVIDAGGPFSVAFSSMYDGGFPSSTQTGVLDGGSTT